MTTETRTTSAKRRRWWPYGLAGMAAIALVLILWPSRQIKLWTLGSARGDAAGWHCSWCVTIDRIVVKLTSAQNGDFPLWGDYPAKLNVTYLSKLVGTGTWFDDVTRMKRREVIAGPPSLLANKERYRHLIENPYSSSNSDKVVLDVADRRVHNSSGPVLDMRSSSSTAHIVVASALKQLSVNRTSS